MQAPLLDCGDESAGQKASRWRLPCGHIVCTDCFYGAGLLSPTSTLYICPCEGCTVLFRHIEAGAVVGSTVVEESDHGVVVEVATNQDPPSPIEQAPIPSRDRGYGGRRGRGGSSQAPHNTSNQASSPNIPSDQGQVPEPASQTSSSQVSATSSQGSTTLTRPLSFPVPGTFSSQPRTAPSQPSPLRYSFPPVEPAFPSSQANQSSPPPSQSSPLLGQSNLPSSQSSPPSSQQNNHSPFSSQRSFNSSQTSTTSVGSSSSVESDGTTISDIELAATLEREIPFENPGDGEGEESGENAGDAQGQGDRDAEGGTELEGNGNGEEASDDHERQADDHVGGQGTNDEEVQPNDDGADITGQAASGSRRSPHRPVPATQTAISVHASLGAGPTTPRRTGVQPQYGGKRRRTDSVCERPGPKKRTASAQFATTSQLRLPSSSLHSMPSSSPEKNHAYDRVWGDRAQAEGRSCDERGDSEDDREKEISSSSP